MAVINILEIEILEESSIYIPAMCPLESIIGFELFVIIKTIGFV